MSPHYESVLKNHILNYEPFLVPTKSSWLPIGIDFFLRAMSFIVLKVKWITYAQFIQYQILIIPIAVIIFSFLRSRGLSKKISKKINIKLFPTSPSFITVSLVLVALILNYFFLDNAMYYEAETNWGYKTFFKIGLEFLYLIYLLIILFLLSPTSKVEGEIKFFPLEPGNYYCLQLPTLEKINKGEYLSEIEEGEKEIDRNDQALTVLETNAKNISGRIEIFTIESVFLGALAFSAFIAIVSSDNVQQELLELKTLPSLFSEFLYYLSVFQLDEVSSKWDSLSRGIYLFGVLAVETLFCSIFFILVLANRMILSNNVDKLNHIVNLANRYNAKEEEIEYLTHQSVQGLDKRQGFLKRKIESLVKDGQNIFNRISPLYKIVAFLRGIGIYLFYLVLITGGLFYSDALAIWILIILISINIVRFLISESNIKIINLIFELNQSKGKKGKT